MTKEADLQRVDLKPASRRLAQLVTPIGPDEPTRVPMSAIHPTGKPLGLRDQAHVVRPPGFEPGTCGLRVHCSAIELEARSYCRRSPGGAGAGPAVAKERG